MALSHTRPSVIATDASIVIAKGRNWTSRCATSFGHPKNINRVIGQNSYFCMASIYALKDNKNAFRKEYNQINIYRPSSTLMYLRKMSIKIVKSTIPE